MVVKHIGADSRLAQRDVVTDLNARVGAVLGLRPHLAIVERDDPPAVGPHREFHDGDWHHLEAREVLLIARFFAREASETAVRLGANATAVLNTAANTRTRKVFMAEG